MLRVHPTLQLASLKMLPYTNDIFANRQYQVTASIQSPAENPQNPTLPKCTVLTYMELLMSIAGANLYKAGNLLARNSIEIIHRMLENQHQLR